MTTSDRARWLIDRYFDDGLTAAEREELEQALQSDPRAARLFARVSRFDSALRDELVTDRGAAAMEELFRREETMQQAPVVAPPPLPVKPDDSPLWTAWSRLVPTGVILAAAALIGWALFAPRHEEAPATAKVVSGSISIDGKPVSEVPAETPFEVSGRERASLTLADGSRMVAGPESRAILHRPEGEIRQRVELQQGQAFFSVEKGPGSFRVETGAMRLIVAGTEFTVRVIPAVRTLERRGEERAEISVTQGRVVIHVTEGDTIVLDAGQKRIVPGERREAPRPQEPREREPNRGERDEPRGDHEQPRRDAPRPDRGLDREQPRRDAPLRETPRPQRDGDRPNRDRRALDSKPRRDEL